MENRSRIKKTVLIVEGEEEVVGVVAVEAVVVDGDGTYHTVHFGCSQPPH